jgi:hypothetical protein
LGKFKTPEDCNEFLLNRYGYGFYEYALCFAFYLRDPDFRFQYSVNTELPEVLGYHPRGYYEDIERERRKKIREKNTILNTEGLSENYFCSEAKSHVVEHLNDINKEIRQMDEELLDRPIWIRGRGRRVKIRTIIASIFAQVILKNGQTEWVNIEELFWSFWDFLEGASYRKELGEEKADFFYYKLQNEYKEIVPRKEYEIQRLARIFFPVPRKKKFVNIKFEKDWITIDEKYSRYPQITFPNSPPFREDITLRKATPPLKDFPVKKTRKKEEVFTFHVTKDLYLAIKKYEKLKRERDHLFKELNLIKI